MGLDERMTRDTGTREDGWHTLTANILDRVSSGEEKTKRMKRGSVHRGACCDYCCCHLFSVGDRLLLDDQLRGKPPIVPGLTTVLVHDRTLLLVLYLIDSLKSNTPLDNDNP